MDLELSGIRHTWDQPSSLVHRNRSSRTVQLTWNYGLAARMGGLCTAFSSLLPSLHVVLLPGVVVQRLLP